MVSSRKLSKKQGISGVDMVPFGEIENRDFKRVLVENKNWCFYRKVQLKWPSQCTNVIESNYMAPFGFY